jgi:hypothetical protein
MWRIFRMLGGVFPRIPLLERIAMSLVHEPS